MGMRLDEAGQQNGALTVDDLVAVLAALPRRSRLMRSPAMVTSVAASPQGLTFLRMIFSVTTTPFTRSLQLGIESIAQPIAQQVDGQDDKAELESRKQHHPPAAGKEILIADADQRAERRLGHRHADAQER